MIIDELVLNNFAIFGGRQSVRLDPPSADRPVVLFGGLNGAGKTTLLEALQLALFGKLAPPVRDSEGGYEAYLERSIHRRARPKDGASVEIAFRSTGDGQERAYRVRRSWAARRRNVTERLDVKVDGVPDTALADTWADQVHQFLPPQLAPLFLFDGERIEALADPGTSENFLSVAIDALLGMDLVRQLEVDLAVLERRKRAESLSDDARRKWQAESEYLNGLDTEIKEKKTYAGSLRNRLDSLARSQQAVDQEFRAQGGELLERRESLEKERTELLADIAGHRRTLVEFASGVLPLALVRHSLSHALERADREAETEEAREDLRRLQVHRTALETRLTTSGVSEQAIQVVTDYFAQIETHVGSVHEGSVYLRLPTGTRETARRVVTAGLDGELARAGSAYEELSKAIDRLDEVDKQLAAVPEAEAIRDISARRSKLIADQEESSQELDVAVEQIRELEVKRARQIERVDRLLKEAASESLEQERQSRLLTHSAWARDTLKQFRRAALDRNLSRIQNLVLDCYQSLLRKQSLVAEIRIDPSKHRMRLYDSAGREVLPTRLSAGERQLLAVATLWGLARAAGRPLPVVVDTPLGRLDGGHRQHLVTRYFPEASHQVLLLSTDEEIVANYLAQLQPAIGRIYRLEYDDETSSTRIQEGYFEEVAAA